MPSFLAPLVVFGVLLSTAFADSARPPFRLHEIVAEPGTIASGFVPVPDGDDADVVPEEWSKIPVSIAHGIVDGPTLLLIAGVHGTEYNPIMALQRLRADIDAAALSGTVILVHIANPASFYGRTSFRSPDGKNLNRQFPGDLRGSLTDRIAHVLVNDLIARASAVVDIHCGDGAEVLEPWVGYYARVGSPNVIAESRNMALAFGIPLIVPFQFEIGADGATVYTGPNALVRDIPAFDVECGGLQQVQDVYVDRILDGIRNLMRYMGMVPGAAVPLRNPLFITGRDYLTVSYNGIYYMDSGVRVGEHIAKGAPVGVLTDAFGTVVQEFTAVNSGLVLIAFTGAVMNKGETALVIAHTSDQGSDEGHFKFRGKY